MPVRTEGSADEDLLEDSSRAIEGYLYTRGYRDAMVVYTSQQEKEELVITFEIKRGPRYIVRSVSFTGNAAVPEMELLPLVRLKTGEPFVRSAVSTGIGAIERLYRARGYTRVQVKAGESVLVPENTAAPDRGPTCRLQSSRGRELIGLRASRQHGDQRTDIAQPVAAREQAFSRRRSWPPASGSISSIAIAATRVSW